MFPMVTTVDEVRRARELLDQARESLYVDGVPAPERVEVGIMVEVPAAALMTRRSSRTWTSSPSARTTSPSTSWPRSAATPMWPPLPTPCIRPCCASSTAPTRAAAEAGRPVAVCGELAGDPSAVALLLGLGVTELSMAPARIPAAKQAVRATVMSEARQLAAEALAAESAADVRRLCSGAAR